MVIFFTRFSVVTETGGFAHLGEWFHRTERLPRVLRKIARLRRPKPAGTEMLFSDARMDFRFACFEALTLPSLAGQTDRDFVHVVLYAQELPERYKRRLQDLSARHGFLLHDMDRKTSFEQKYVEVCKALTGGGDAVRVGSRPGASTTTMRSTWVTWAGCALWRRPVIATSS